MATFGITSCAGVFMIAVTNYQHEINWDPTWQYLPGAGTLIRANVWAQIAAPGGTNQFCVHLYTYNANPALCTIVASSVVQNVTNTSPAWVQANMTGTIAAGVTYIIVVQGYNSVASRLRIGMPITYYPASRHLGDTDFIPPANLGGCVQGNQIRCVNIDFTPGAGGPAGDPDGFGNDLYKLIS